ncbi:MAG: rRNA maturation RNase YbeY [Fervidobacterium sp.]
MIKFENYPEELKKFLDSAGDSFEQIVQNEIGDVYVEFIFVDSNTMAKLNTEFRGKQGPTDVLTFVYGKDNLIKQDTEDENFIQPYAEGYLCIDVIKENGEKFENPFEKELLTVIIHSILHMAGYDHEYNTENAQEMFDKQSKYVEQVWSKLSLSN